jgi:hypothetical protein
LKADLPERFDDHLHDLVKRYAPAADPASIAPDIEKLLQD